MTGSSQDLFQQIAEEGSHGLDSAFSQTTRQTSESDDAEQAFRIVQDGTEYEIAALDSEDYGGRTDEEFYGYGEGDGASANTPNGMEEAELSQLFFYDGPETTSLVVIHDEPNTGDGGEVTFEFEQLPQEGEWVVPDDPWDVGYDDGRVTWHWFACCTDGGVYRGGFETPFWVEITPQFREGIDSTAYGEPWVAVDGSDGDLERLPLDPTKPITITSAGKLNTSVGDADYNLEIGGEVCVSVESDQNICVSREPIVTLGPRFCAGAPGGKTPPLASVEINYVEEQETEDGVTVTFERNFWVGFELNGAPCIWYGEEVLGICARLEGCLTAPRPNPINVPYLDEVTDTADDIVGEISEYLPENDVVEDTVEPGIIIFLIILGALFAVEPSSTVVVVGITIVISGDDDEESDDDEED